MVDRQGFARQRRLVNLDGVAGLQGDIGRYDVAQPQPDQIIRNQLARGNGAPLPVAPHARLRGERRLERVDRIAGLIFFPETDDDVHKQQHQDDAEVGPVPNDRRQDRRNLDHPWNRPPKVTGDSTQHARLFFGQLVESYLVQTLLCILLAQPDRFIAVRCSVRTWFIRI